MEPIQPGSAQKKSPWQYLGCGCAGLVIVALLAVSVLTWIMYRQGQELEETMKDPAARTAKTREVLPWRSLPPGYHPVGAFSVPFLMDMALFSDREPPAGESPRGASLGDRGFLFIHMRAVGGMGARRDELEAFIEGKSGQPLWFQKSDLRLNTRDPIRHGVVSSTAGGGTGGQEILYSANRGELVLDNEKRQGILTLLLAECPGDDRIRLGIWFGPDPARGQKAEPAAYAGTPADPEAIREFAGHFQFCAGSSPGN